jgi:hypothetical protein
MPKLRGGIQDQNIKPPGLSPAALDVVVLAIHGRPTAAASNEVATVGSVILSATSVASTTFAAGTQPDFARNLIYEINISGDATGMVSAGTLTVNGWDLASNTCQETVALTHIASAGSASFVNGSKCFQSISGSGFTVSGYLLATASSTRSKSISLYVGPGSKLGLPNSVQSSNPSACPAVYLGSTVQGSASVTVVSGNVGDAGVSFSNAFSSGSDSEGQVIVYQRLNR